MATSQTVAEIFTAAGKAFDSLGTMTMQLHPNPETQPNSKWTVAEVDALHKAVKRFGDDLNQLAEQMKSRTVSQIKQKIRDEMLSNTGDDNADSNEPPSKKVKADESAEKDPPTIQKGDKSTAADDATSDVDSLTVYSELHVDEEASEGDASDVDV